MMEKYSSPLSYLGGIVTTGIGIFTLEQWVGLIGIICTLGTFFVNWYYRKKEFELKEHHYEDTEKNIDGNGR
ncbi:phage holin family protein [Arsenophonus nasoniae]|uniref:Phage holin family protein n=1 Tax=Arsenophonus nasoniae TaxID=638 RepID=A0AA95GV59_9GAMM|nr:phage holin family protein [Arsenophonus nasoniae]WGM03781.1 phage holin family protein [Arsenophonus nasoniae]WGM03833.1 phage holin family protein [Arsenophonus nasoniae]WGM03893.1 phage holin family protein [Arsenophonus nasoniae]